MSQKDTHALIDTELALHCFKQMEQMSNPELHEKLHEFIEVYDHLGGEPWMSRVQVEALLADPTTPTHEEQA